MSGVAQVGRSLEALFRRATPDPLVLAVLLTAGVGLVGWVHVGFDAGRVIDAWSGPRGLWALLGFGMQMCLVLVTGHALAAAPPMRRFLEAMARWPRSGPAAAAMVAGVSIALGLFNWGLGLVAGALLAREVGRSTHARGVDAHGPLLAACGYAGMMTWHGGFSGSAPLKVARASDIVEVLGPEVAAVVQPVPTTETLLGPLNLAVSLGLLVLIPLTAFALSPRSGGALMPAASPEERPSSRGLEDHPLLAVLLLVPLAWAVVRYFAAGGLARLDPNGVNLTLLTVGLALHGSLGGYRRAVESAVKGCSGIILQFPLYAGIMGVMAGTGLARDLAGIASSAPGRGAYLAGTFLVAGLVNLMIPSGGGQWAIQGPVAAQAASDLGVPFASAVMAVAYGDQWTNMLQPFWALPLLGITGVKAGEMMGYSAAFLVVGGAWMLLCLLILG